MYRVYKIDIIIIYNSCVCTICEKHKTILCTKKNTTVNDLEYIYIPLDTRTHTHTHTYTHKNNKDSSDIRKEAFIQYKKEYTTKNTVVNKCFTCHAAIKAGGGDRKNCWEQNALQTEWVGELKVKCLEGSASSSYLPPPAEF